jgi:hypothetical protein
MAVEVMVVADFAATAVASILEAVEVGSAAAVANLASAAEWGRSSAAE